MRLRLAMGLALAQLRHDRGAALCQMAGLAALLLPLLILFGIKNGVLADRTAALLRDPEALRITIGRTEAYPAALLRSLAADPDVRFVAPHPVQLAVIADFSPPRPAAPVVTGVVLLATGAGDPYLPVGLSPPASGEVVLSAPLAGRLGLSAGDRVDALLRPTDHEPGGGVFGLTVTGVIEAGLWGRMGALLETGDLFLIQDWTHGLVSGPDLGALRGAPPERDSFPSLRLYAASPEAAFRLMARLAAEGVPTGGAPQQAQSLLFLRQALNAGFVTVALVGLAGVTATFAANLWLSIARNRRTLSLLRLGGLDRAGAMMIPLTQALAIGFGGWILSLAAYAVLTGLLDRLLASSFAVADRLARLGAPEIAASGLATLAVSALAAIWAAAAVTSISPEEGMSDAH